MFKDAALKEELLIDMNVEQASWNPHHGSPPPARWYAQHISWLNALEPPHVLWNKIIKSGPRVEKRKHRIHPPESHP